MVGRVPQVLITVDCELSSRAHGLGQDVRENFTRRILGRTPLGDFGLPHKLARLRSAKLPAVFFVEALHALVLGPDWLRRIAEPILADGHEVELHLHAEWLHFLRSSPLKGPLGRDMADYDEDDQRRLIDLGLAMFDQAGLPVPLSLRAGNFGANDATLRAAAAAGLRYDLSFNGAMAHDACRIRLPQTVVHPLTREGIIELPVSAFFDYPGHLRPLHICAVSADEMDWMLAAAHEQAWPLLTIVSHSFEFIHKDSGEVDPLIVARFDHLCTRLAEIDSQGQVTSLAALDAVQLLSHGLPQQPVQSSIWRTAKRMTEQLTGRTSAPRRHPTLMPDTVQPAHALASAQRG